MKNKDAPSKLPEGLSYRGGSLWMRFRIRGKLYQEPVPKDEQGVQLSPRRASALRAERITQLRRGEIVADSRKLTIAALLDAVLTDYEANDYSSIATAKSRIGILKDAIGTHAAMTFATDDWQRLVVTWKRAGLSAGTINRRRNLLARAFRLAWQAGKLPRVPFLPKLDEEPKPGRYIGVDEAAKIMEYLPDYARDPFAFSIRYGTRKAQLCNTLRRHVDLERELVEWPGSQTKSGKPHTLPLEGDGLAIVERAMEAAVPHCPFLFHGRDCAPDRVRPKSTKYGCLGNLHDAFVNACTAAGLPVGRKHGGFVWHNTRNTAATTLIAGGATIDDVMKIGNWQTADVARRYDLGNLDALRARMVAARGAVVRLAERRKKA
jgi:integrase